MKKGQLLAFLLLMLSYTGYSQNLESIGEAKPLEVSGGVSLNSIFYTASGIDNRRDPFNYFATGNINFNFYGWSVPLSFTYSNQNTTFQQPFNQYGLHPTYKWVTGHFGYASMSFSPYTLSGHLFLGAGVDLEPSEKFKFSAMYGRLQKAVQPDSLNDASIPAFHRMGYGFKATYGTATDNISMIMFKATDDEKSLDYIPENQEVLPEDNLVLSLTGSKMIVKDLLVHAEVATSAITRDIRAETYDPESKNVFSYVGGLYKQRQSSSYYNAYKFGMSYKIGAYSVGAGYERVEPGYRTLGAYYFNNDLENITANAATALFKGKVSIGVNMGVQRDNLDDDKVSTMNRFVGSGNIAYTPNNRLNMSANFSSFQTYTNIRSQFQDINQLTPYDNLDTLNYTQISQSTNLNINYLLANGEYNRQNLSMNITYQDASDKQGGVEQNSGSQFYMANAAYSLNIVPQNMAVTVAFNYNKNQTADINATTMGPTIGVNRTFFEKKMRSAASVSMNNAYTNSTLTNRVVNLRLTGSYSLKKKHSFNLSMVALNRETKREEGAQAFTEFTGTFGYSYRF